MDLGECNYAQLNKMLVITDLFDRDPEPEILSGIAIRAEDMKDFLKAVESLAFERFGGATFENLMEYDVNDFAAELSARRHDRERTAEVIDATDEILRRAAESKRQS